MSALEKYFMEICIIEIHKYTTFHNYNHNHIYFQFISSLASNTISSLTWNFILKIFNQNFSLHEKLSTTQ